MRALPEGFTVVSDVEFETLRYLPEFELTNADTLRRQVGEQFFFVWRQSDFERYEAIAAGVEAEILAMEKAHAEPKVQEAEIAPEQPAITKKDQERFDRLFPMQLPNHPPSSRPPSWFRPLIDPFGEH